MEKTVTMRFSEYEELCKFKEAYEKNLFILQRGTFPFLESIDVISKEQLDVIIRERIQDLEHKLSLTTKKKWWQFGG